MSQELVRITQKLYEKHRYTFCDGGAYDLNFFGIRRNLSSNKFDDLIGCIYRPQKGAGFTIEVWPGTTDPGKTYLENPMNAKGTAAVADAQHKACWSLGEYKTRPALTQTGIMRVYRDGDRNAALYLDPATLTTGSGIHLHYMGNGLDRDVNSWSAGCQGVALQVYHDRVIWLARKQIQVHPTWKTFSYTLFDTDKDPEAMGFFA